MSYHIVFFYSTDALPVQTVADNFKTWVAAVVTGEGGMPVTEKHPIGGGGQPPKLTGAYFIR